MRVTTKAYTTNYLKNNNSLLTNLLKSESKILSQRKYNRASEDSVSAAKAAHVRKSLSNLKMYDENCQTAKDLFYAAEEVLYDIANSTFLNVIQKVDSAQDTKNQVQLDILAAEIEEMADHMVQDMNSDFAERQMFGSTSNDKTPFTVYSRVEVFDKDGNVVKLLGNQPDTAEKNGNPVNVFTMSGETFYDAEGNAIDYTTAAPDTELFTEEGVKYGVKADGSGNLIAPDGTVYTEVFTPTQKYYDAEGNEIVDLENYSGEVYYSSADIESPDTVKFTVNGSFDGSNAQKDRIVCYNDVPVDFAGDDLLNTVNGGMVVCYDEKGNVVNQVEFSKDNNYLTGDHTGFPGSKPIYVDIGLGINYAKTKIDSTALDVSLNGAQITGYGTDKDGDALNLIQLTYDAANALRAGDLESVNRFIDKLDDANTKVLNTITDLGIKQNNLDFYTSKNEVYRLSLLEKQNDLEGCDLEAEITNWKTVDAAYNASLSMGSKVLPKSLFDFI